jgi:hypothetical protein
VGIATGYGIAYTIEVQLKPRITNEIIGNGRWSLLIPAIIGCLIYFRFFKGYEWLAKITMGFWIGYGAGNFLAFNPATYMPQLFNTFIRLDSIQQRNLLRSSRPGHMVFHLYHTKGFRCLEARLHARTLCADGSLWFCIRFHHHGIPVLDYRPAADNPQGYTAPDQIASGTIRIHFQ